MTLVYRMNNMHSQVSQPLRFVYYLNITKIILSRQFKLSFLYFILFYIPITKIYMVLVSYAAGSPMCTLLVFVSLCSCCAPDARSPLVIDFNCNGLLAFASSSEVAEKSHVHKLAEWHQSFTCYNQLILSFKNDYLQATYRINVRRSASAVAPAV